VAETATLHSFVLMDYLVYHPKREISEIGDLKIYHDSFSGNQDPYLWNDRFLHSYCHITQLRIEPKNILFWVSGDTYPNFTKLLCDCVFVIDKKEYWKNANQINLTDSIVDNEQTFDHHYKWVNPPFNQHLFKRRRRYTLKADNEKSFQPQTENGELIDVIPFFEQQGISTETLINSMAKNKSGKKSMNSRPFKLTPEQSPKLYKYLTENSPIKIKGKDIELKHPETKKKTLCP
jgi:hypothetical protein